MSLGIHSNMKAIKQKLENNNSAITSTNNLAFSKLVVVSSPLEPTIRSINNLVLAILVIADAPLKPAKTSTSESSFAAKLLVGKEALAPYFKHREGDQFVAAAVALAVITVFIITKSGRDSTASQFLLNLQNTQVSGLNVDQLLDIRQTALLGELY